MKCIFEENIKTVFYASLNSKKGNFSYCHKLITNVMEQPKYFTEVDKIYFAFGTFRVFVVVNTIMFLQLSWYR